MKPLLCSLVTHIFSMLVLYVGTENMACAGGNAAKFPYVMNK